MGSFSCTSWFQVELQTLHVCYWERHCCSPWLLWSATSSPRGQKLQVLGERGVGCCQEIALFASPAGRKQYFSRNWAHCSPNKNTRSGQHHNTILPPSTLNEGCNIETNPSLLHLFYSLPNKRWTTHKKMFFFRTWWVGVKSPKYRCKYRTKYLNS